MEGMQEHTVTPRAARNTGQRGNKQEGGTGNKGGRTPMNPRNSKGKVATPTKPAQLNQNQRKLPSLIGTKMPYPTG